VCVCSNVSSSSDDRRRRRGLTTCPVCVCSNVSSSSDDGRRRGLLESLSALPSQILASVSPATLYLSLCVSLSLSLSVCLSVSVCLCVAVSGSNVKSRSSHLAPAHPGGPGRRAVKRSWCGVAVE